MLKHSLKSICLFICLNSVVSSAQYVAPDSLKKIIASSKNEMEKIDAMNWLAFRYYQEYEVDSSRVWVQKALSLSEKHNYHKGLGFANLNLGNLKSAVYEISASVPFFKKSIAEFEKSGDKALLSMGYNYLGGTYLSLERYPESIKNIYKALQLATESGYRHSVARAHLLLGRLYSESADVSPAYPHLEIAIDLYHKEGEIELLASSYWNRGMAGLGEKKYQQAISDFNAARIIAKDSKNNLWYETDYYRAFGLMHTSRGDSCKAANNINASNEQYKLAEKYLFESLKKCPEYEVYMVALIKNNMALLYLSWGKYELSRSKVRESVQLTDSARDKRLLESNYYSLARIDSQQGDFKSAYVNMLKSIRYHNDLYNEENVRKREGYKAEFEMEKSKDQLRILSAESEMKTAIVSKQKQQKNLVITGTSILLIAGVYWFQRYRNKKRKQNQQEIAEERLRISRDLHDEIGATLSGIAMYSHMVKGSLDTNNTNLAIQSANIIQDSSTEMVNKLNDIVWLIKPQNETMEALFERLKNFTTEICATKNIVPEIKVTPEAASNTPPLDKRKNIYLICKEAINNAVKYSGATELAVHFIGKEKWLHIIVKDNGQGFNPDSNKNGNGLTNMRDRAEQIDGILNINTAPGIGCTVELQLKIT